MPVIDDSIVRPETPVDYKDILANSSKPWYLKSEELYEVLKAAVSDFHLGNVDVSERAIEVIDGAAQMVRKNVFRISEEEGVSLVRKVDDLIKSVLTTLDNGVDKYRVKLAESLGQFEVALVSNVEWVNESVKVQANEARKQMEDVTKQAQNFKGKVETEAMHKVDQTKSVVKSAYGTADDRIKAWLKQLEQNYPPSVVVTVKKCLQHPRETPSVVYSFVKSIMQESLKRVDPYVHYYLDTAQPYVVKAVDMSQPIVHIAQEYSQPIVEVAYDMSLPVVDRVVSHPTVAPVFEKSKEAVAHPVVQLALSTTSEAMEIVKEYCSNNKEYYQHAISAAVNQYEKARQLSSVTNVDSCPSSSGARGAVVDAETGYIYDAASVPAEVLFAGDDNNYDAATLLGDSAFGPKSSMAFGDTLGIRSRDDIASAGVIAVPTETTVGDDENAVTSKHHHHHHGIHHTSNNNKEKYTTDSTATADNESATTAAGKQNKGGNLTEEQQMQQQWSEEATSRQQHTQDTTTGGKKNRGNKAHSQNNNNE